MIGKVLRGSNVRRLLYYLYGPGRANEHTDPHLVAGFGDPAELEPERRGDGPRDFRRLAGLLAQPLAALAGPGFGRPVWHCAVRAAPGDRMLSDADWAQVAAGIMRRTGLAAGGDDLGVRWVAVRHAADHVHIVATLARQDGARPRVWNDFYRVREACQDAERRFGLCSTAAADRTAARRPGRAETEHAARRGWAEPPRVTLRREVSAAAGGARTERDFFASLQQAGVLLRRRHSAVRPGEVTGYAVALPHHTSKDGGVIWYGGGKVAADLTLPRLRARWTGAAAADPVAAAELPPAASRAVLRNVVTGAAGRARDEAGYFGLLRESGVLVRLRFSEADPGQITGYSVAFAGQDGAPCWYGGGRLAADLTLPRLRRRWGRGDGAVPEHYESFRFTAPERNAIYGHAARQAASAAEHIRRCAGSDPSGAADAAWAAADALNVAARAVRSRSLRCAADAYDRAARTAHGRIPRRTGDGDRLRATARLLGLLGSAGDGALAPVSLVANLSGLSAAVAELRQAQNHAAQAAAARAAAAHLHEAVTQARSHASHPGQSRAPRRPGAGAAAGVPGSDFPRLIPATPVPAHPAGKTDPRLGRRPGRRAGPAP